MTGGVKLEFTAMTINEAIMTATERWRILVEDPEATLPWSTHIEFYEEPRADDGSQTMCIARIEFDRKVTDELTGATSAA
jgi:hypothetical protein